MSLTSVECRYKGWLWSMTGMIPGANWVPFASIWTTVGKVPVVIPKFSKLSIVIFQKIALLSRIVINQQYFFQYRFPECRFSELSRLEENLTELKVSRTRTFSFAEVIGFYCSDTMKKFKYTSWA